MITLGVLAIWPYAALRALAVRCAGVLTEAAQDSTMPAARNGVHFYRVRRDLPCLRELAR